MQIEGEFPELLAIKESLIEYVFKPNAAKKDEVGQPYIEDHHALSGGPETYH